MDESTVSSMLACPLPPSFLDTYSLSTSSVIIIIIWKSLQGIGCHQVLLTLCLHYLNLDLSIYLKTQQRGSVRQRNLFKL